MTDDLVQRLRGGGETCGIDACKIRDVKGGCLCATAADRIEQLEAALRIICDGPRDADKSYPELLAEVRCEARDALEKK